MRKIEEFDHVVLKDGREGAIVEVFCDKTGEAVEFLVDIGSSPADWDTISVQLEEIETVSR